MSAAAPGRSAEHRAAAPHHRPLDLSVMDALRGLAALYVMLGHAAGLLWAGDGAYTADGGQGVGLMLAHLAHHGLRWGHQAVLLFFLISGFCIHHRQAKALVATPRADRSGPFGVPFGLRSYALRRARRLYPPLLVALLLTALFDTIGIALNPDFYAGRTAYPDINSFLGGSTRSFEALLGNLLMQSGFAAPAFGTNGPLWSLAYESWFYVLYPVVLLLSTRWGLRGVLGVTGALSIVGLLLLPGQVPSPGSSLAASPTPLAWIASLLTLWVVWAVGALIAEAHMQRLSLRGLGWLLPVALVGLAVNARLLVPRADLWRLSDLVWGASCAVLLAYVMVAAPPRLGRAVEHLARLLAPLGSISYSLYVVHVPFLVLLSAAWLSSHPQLPLGAELALAGAFSALALASLCWYLVERHFVIARPRSRGSRQVSPGGDSGAVTSLLRGPALSVPEPEV